MRTTKCKKCRFALYVGSKRVPIYCDYYKEYSTKLENCEIIPAN